MKKYPYTDSTELIMYEGKVKKKRKSGGFMPCLLSAMLASAITAGAMTAGGYFYKKPQSSVIYSEGQSSHPISVEQLVTSNGKRELSVNEIAKKPFPSSARSRVLPVDLKEPCSQSV